MTVNAFVKQADLVRMAKVAKREGVTVWIEKDGFRIGVSPNLPALDRKSDVEDDEEIRL